MEPKASNSAECMVREIKRKTRRKFNSEEKIRIILEALKGEDSIAAICRREGIRVNAVCPAYIQIIMTEGAIAGDPELATRIAALHPVGRIGTPEEVAETVM